MKKTYIIPETETMEVCYSHMLAASKDAVLDSTTQDNGTALERELDFLFDD